MLTRPMDVFERDRSLNPPNEGNANMSTIDAHRRRRRVEANERISTSSPPLVRNVSERWNVSPGWVRDHATNRRHPALPAWTLSRSLQFSEDDSRTGCANYRSGGEKRRATTPLRQ